MTEVWPLSRPAQFGEGTVWPRRGWAFPSWRPRCPPRLPQPVLGNVWKALAINSAHHLFPIFCREFGKNRLCGQPESLEIQVKLLKTSLLPTSCLPAAGGWDCSNLHTSCPCLIPRRQTVKIFLKQSVMEGPQEGSYMLLGKGTKTLQKKRRGPFYLDSTDQISLRIIHLTRSIQIFQTWQSVPYALSPRLEWGWKTLSPADRSEGRWAGRPIAELRRCRNSSPQLPRHTASSLSFLKTNTQIPKHSTLK